MDVVAEKAVVSRYGVGANLLECVTLVRVSGCVIDRAGEVVLGQLLTSRLAVIATPATAAPSSTAPFAATIVVTAAGFCWLRNDVCTRRENLVLGRVHQLG
jgi:hypothetical protein